MQIRDFTDQGRRIQFCGLPHAVLEASEHVDFHTETVAGLDACAGRVAQRVSGWKPLAWYVVAALSFLLVWMAIMSAFIVSFMTPTIGIGCRTLMYLLFGGFSSVSWLIQFWKRPPRWAIWVSYLCNSLAVMAMLVVIIFQVGVS